MGWDAFGLPAENAAIANQVPPAEWTRENIADMRAQLQRWASPTTGIGKSPPATPVLSLGAVVFYAALRKRAGLQKDGHRQLGPRGSDRAGNEQVIDGRGWRSGALVERREIPQWFIRITSYAEELLDGLDHA